MKTRSARRVSGGRPRRAAWCVALGLTSILAGCGGGFFTKPGSGTTGGGGSTPGSGASTNDFVYVVNQGSDTLAEFSIKQTTLTAITGSPLSLPAALNPTAVAVTRANTYVYVAGAGGIFCYSIATDGSLAQVTTGGATASANFVSLDTSPDGQWLLALDQLNNIVDVYKINTSTGALTLNTNLQYPAPGKGTLIPTALRISPDAGLLMVALGTGGDAVFTFNTATGVLTSQPGLGLSGYSDNGLTFDSSSTHVYMARASLTGSASGVASYAIDASGRLTTIQTLAAGGSAPSSVVIDGTGAYVYAGNRAVSATTNLSTISGYSTSSGTLTALADSPFSASAHVTALTLDQSGKFLIAAASGGPADVTLYAEDAISLGKLDAVSTASSGTNPVAIATTH